MVVSYSGSNPDVAQVVERASGSVGRVILLTARPDARRAPNQGNGSFVVAAYGAQEHVGERGFVSIAAAVAPAAVVAAAVCGAHEVLSLASLAREVVTEVADVAAAWAPALQAGWPLEVLGTAWAFPAMQDVESKLTETGLGIARLHEAKDFSHGRFVSVLNQKYSRPALLLGTGKTTLYEERLREVLQRHCVFFELRSTEESLLGAVDLLTQVQYLVEHVGRQLGADISRPRTIPADGLSLYQWESPLDE
jgi:fructoselysine-6-P-deglycase FrlB-like protein